MQTSRMSSKQLVRRSSVPHRSLILAAALLAASAAHAAPSGQPSILPAVAPLRIVAFGSSSTQGVGASSPAWTYPAQLQDVLARLLPHGRHVQVINRGIGGEDADDMAKRLQNDVIARHPDVVIFQTGSNDPLRHVPLDRFERETRDGIAAMRKAGIEVILMEPQWCPRLDTMASANSYRDSIRKIGLETHVEVVRRSDLMHAWLRQGLLTQHQMLSSDGLHMTDGGYALLARSVAPEVLKVEDIRPAVQAAAVR